MTVKVIVFDFDGTIADTYDAFVEIVNRLSGEFGYRPVTETELADYKHLSSRELVKRSEIPLVKIPFILRRVKAELSEKMQHLQPIDGMDSCLHDLKKQGYSLGILTSNAKENVIAFLKNNQLESLFDFIYSGTTLFGKHKVINKVLQERKFSAREMVYVGDETRDIHAARNSHVKIVAVGWGFNSPEILQEHHPDAFAAQPQNLSHILQAWQNPRSTQDKPLAQTAEASRSPKRER